MRSDERHTARRRSVGSWLLDAAAFAAVALLFWLTPLLSSESQTTQTFGAALLLVLGCAFSLRWRFPLAAALLALLATTLAWLIGATTDPMIGMAWCLYPLALQDSGQKRTGESVLVGVLAVGAVLAGVSSPTHDVLQTAAFGLGAMSVAWLLGRSEAARIRALREGERQQLEIEQIRRETIMAREVHDVVGHALSTISAEAGIARTIPNSSKAELLETLESIEQRSRSALEEVQALVRALRQRHEGIGHAESHQRSEATLRDVIVAASVSGLELETHIDLPDHSPEIVFVATRVTQEALSNVVRHAGATHCELSIAPDEATLVVQIDDNGVGLSNSRSESSGLLGMRERVESVGGELIIANRLAGGTRVLARLPLARS